MLSLSQAELLHKAASRLDARRHLAALDVTAAGVATAMCKGGNKVFKQVQQALRETAES